MKKQFVNFGEYIDLLEEFTETEKRLHKLVKKSKFLLEPNTLNFFGYDKLEDAVQADMEDPDSQGKEVSRIEFSINVCAKRLYELSIDIRNMLVSASINYRNNMNAHDDEEPTQPFGKSE